MSSCPLCFSETSRNDEIVGNSGARFGLCRSCLLIFRPPADRPGREAERQRYLSHENSSEDAGYVRFLLRPFRWARQLIELRGRILDYGCGFAPVFTKEMQSRGFDCDNYDPFFFPHGAQKKEYPVIFCTETVEHFHNTHAEWKKLISYMAPSGYLVVMTDYWLDLKAFPDWYYQNDQTHTSFYHPKTMEYIAQTYGLKLLQTDRKRLALYQRQ